MKILARFYLGGVVMVLVIHMVASGCKMYAKKYAYRVGKRIIYEIEQVGLDIEAYPVYG